MSNNDPATQKLLDTVRKLLAKANDSSVTENEAAAFAEKAQAIVAAHNLSIAEVMEKKAEFVIDKELVTDSFPWKRGIATATAHLYFCSYFYYHRYEGKKGVRSNRSDVHNFVGAPHNIAVAKLMFQYLVETVERLAKVGALTVPKEERIKYRTAFAWACSMRLKARIWKRIQDSKAKPTKVENGNTLPALADLYDRTQKQLTEYMQANVGKMTAKRTNSTMGHSKGASDGYDAGEKIGLDGQVTSKPSGGKITSKRGPLLLEKLLNDVFNK